MDLSKLNLGGYDYILLIDRSGSMSVSDCPGGISRWKQAHEYSKTIAELCSQYDDDGIDVILFDDSFKEFNGVDSAKVDEIFRKHAPRGTTNTAGALKVALPEYFNSVKKGLFGGRSEDMSIVSRNKPVVVIVFTDGQPNSQRELRNNIIHITKRISDDKQVGISFIQVGKDTSARSFLKSLDDDLENEGAKFDIVDTKDYTEMGNLSAEQILIDALTD